MMSREMLNTHPYGNPLYQHTRVRFKNHSEGRGGEGRGGEGRGGEGRGGEGRGGEGNE